jgi:uncharacterized protein YqgV (UPF0045/DUF77 family)
MPSVGAEIAVVPVGTDGASMSRIIANNVKVLDSFDLECDRHGV